MVGLWATARNGRYPIRINSGKVCFQRGSTDQDLEISFSPGCYSGSCTRVLEKSGRVSVDSDRTIIQFYTRFALHNLDFPPGTRRCTADCGGGGSLNFNLQNIEPGLYTVKFGSRSVGALEMPLRVSPDQYVCFNNVYPTLAPSPTYAGPTSTPAPQVTSLPVTPATPIPYPVLSLTPPSQTPTPPYP